MNRERIGIKTDTKALLQIPIFTFLNESHRHSFQKCGGAFSISKLVKFQNGQHELTSMCHSAFTDSTKSLWQRLKNRIRFNQLAYFKMFSIRLFQRVTLHLLIVLSHFGRN